jgi:hypothetical protein
MAQRKGYARYQRICGRRIAADVQMNRPTVQRHSVCGYYFRDCLTFAACLPSAVRVFFGKRFNVCLRLAAWRLLDVSSGCTPLFLTGHDYSFSFVLLHQFLKIISMKTGRAKKKSRMYE